MLSPETWNSKSEIESVYLTGSPGRDIGETSSQVDMYEPYGSEKGMIARLEPANRNYGGRLAQTVVRGRMRDAFREIKVKKKRKG